MDDAQAEQTPTHTPPPPPAPLPPIAAPPSDVQPDVEQQQQQQAPSPSTQRAEEPWRRDEVIHLLRAWRQVAVEASSVAPTADGAEKPSSSAVKARIFEKFCEFYNDDGSVDGATQPRSIKSLMKTKKSLLRSFRFIAVFNQNHVIARTMSSLGGSNWFALPEDEQRRIVKAHYKRKPFAYIDEDMFDAIEMIQEAENPTPAGPSMLASRPGSSPPRDEASYSTRDHGLANMNSGYNNLPDQRRGTDVERYPTPAPNVFPPRVRTPNPVSPNNSNNSNSKATNAWTRADILLLLRVWEDTFDDPRIENEPVAVFDNCVHERFHEHSGGMMLRSPIALKIKRYSLTKSYKFISDFNRNKYPRVGGEPVAHPYWFALSKKERNAVVAEHYKKTHFTHLDEDMLPAIRRIIEKAKNFEPSTAQKPKSYEAAPAQKSPKLFAAGSTSSASVNGGNNQGFAIGTAPTAEVEEWDRRETTLLIRAWRDTVDGLHHKFLPNQAQLGLNARIYQRFIVLSEGDTSRQEHEVSAKRATLINTYELISDFNQSHSVTPSSSPASSMGVSQGWFSMRKNERKARLSQALRPCADIDEATYNALGRILQKNEQQAMRVDTSAAVASSTSSIYPTASPLPMIMPQPSPMYASKGLNVWNQEEVSLLLHAWLAVLQEGAPVENEPLYVFNNRIYRKFFELSNGKTIRTDKALIAKRESVLHSYHFISDFNQNKIIATPNGIGNDWFAVSPVDQKYIVKVYFKKLSFSYLDPHMIGIMDQIMGLTGKKVVKSQPQPQVQVQAPAQAQAPRSPGPEIVHARAIRPNGWTREEVSNLLRAWQDVVDNDPQFANESTVGLNGRIYQRFLELSNGKSDKPDSSLRSKRQSLARTFEFITDFNRKNFLDWFSLRESDRKKHIVNANRLTHCCSNIEEDVFEALTGILGDKNKSSTGTRPSSAVFRQQATASQSQPAADDDSFNADRRENEHDASDDASESATGAPGTPSSNASGSTPNIDDMGSSTPGMDDMSSSSNSVMLSRRPPPSPSSTQAERKRNLVANVLAHIGEQVSRSHEDGSGSGHDASPRRLREDGEFGSSPSEHARKRQKVDTDLGLIASMFETQTQHLASLLHQIKEERKLEHEERRVLLEKIQLDQEERQKDREERAAEREHARREWEHFREERKLEREQDRLLLKALLAQNSQRENVTTQSKSAPVLSSSSSGAEGGEVTSSTSDREPLRAKST